MSDRMAKTLRATPDEWRRVIDVNLFGTIHMIGQFGPQMAERRRGRVINVSACLGRFTTFEEVEELRLGVLTFRRALRLRIESTQRFPAGPGVRRIQYLWLAECYGEVARMTSRDGEVDPDFTEAVEFRRLGL